MNDDELLEQYGFAASDDGYLYVKDEVLTVTEDRGLLDTLRSRFDRAEEVHDDLARLGVSRFRVPGGRDAREFLRAERDIARAPLAPHFVFRGEPIYHGGPASLAAPTSETVVPPPSVPDTGVLVAVVDTGLVEDPEHLWLDARSDVPPGEAEPASEYATPDGRLRVEAGHGTFVAGIVARAAPGARIRAEKVLTSDGYGRELEVALGIAAQADADVINCSLAGAAGAGRPPSAVSRVLEELARRPNGPVVVAAAGNEGTTRRMWPAVGAGVIAVGALAPDGSPAPFSNHGSWVDVWAPGVEVLSTYVVYTEAPGGPNPPRTFTGAARWSGTSFAAPHVAGLIAHHLGETKPANRRAAAEALLATFPLGGPGRVAPER